MQFIQGSNRKKPISRHLKSKCKVMNTLMDHSHLLMVVLLTPYLAASWQYPMPWVIYSVMHCCFMSIFSWFVVNLFQDETVCKHSLEGYWLSDLRMCYMWTIMEVIYARVFWQWLLLTANKIKLPSTKCIQRAVMPHQAQ